jgi:hypothetical protein
LLLRKTVIRNNVIRNFVIRNFDIRNLVPVPCGPLLTTAGGSVDHSAFSPSATVGGRLLPPVVWCVAHCLLLHMVQWTTAYCLLPHVVDF